MFLAAILVAGTITALFPSFMVGTAQATPYPDMDREKKEDKKSVSVSSLKCNNINVNINGLELSVLPPFLGGEVAAEAVEDGETNANSFAGNGESNSVSQINDFRFICINNNNNTVVGAEEQIPPAPPVDECAEDVEACFEEFLSPGDLDALTTALANGLTVPTEPLGEVTFNSFADICEELEGLTEFELLTVMGDILGTVGIVPADINGLVDCIAEAIGITPN